ncbi:hypothetical protein CV770_22630 [Bradyrhizobium sp. AC87j1]|uniref:hypothetical protein n=1 Tax=Bradyrhizobium sp. AC87j1 TaxID=2055894 RepID=UPI000CEC8F57|nr:hypothetical protein [Bradyrhizobium sp. AC87j1]PPQ17160.1 hypothetical protein CV770_22630 [Bradyrhizobium sp. AC87j1]
MSPDGAHTVRLTACMKEAGVKIKARRARIDVDLISHSTTNMVSLARRRHCGETAQSLATLKPE